MFKNPNAARDAAALASRTTLARARLRTARNRLESGTASPDQFRQSHSDLNESIDSLDADPIVSGDLLKEMKAVRLLLKQGLSGMVETVQVSAVAAV